MDKSVIFQIVIVIYETKMQKSSFQFLKCEKLLL